MVVTAAEAVSAGAADGWAVARRVAARLKREGIRSVAVSGSLARGDAGPGSDVDLWAIGDRSGRDERFVGGVPVTVFYSRPRQLRDLRWINRWDIERLVVLFGDDFEQVKRRYARHRPALMRAIERDAEADIAASRGPRRAWLQFQLSVFRATGIRVPKWKHAVALLPPKELARLRRRLELPARIDRRRLLALLRRAPAETERLIKEPVPRWAAAEQHVRYGSLEEAVLKIRSELMSWLGPVDPSRSDVLAALHDAVYR